MNVLLYSTGCPKCNVLKKKLGQKGIDFDEFTDIEKMTDMGFTSVPILSVDGTLLEYVDAVKWINTYGEV